MAGFTGSGKPVLLPALETGTQAGCLISVPQCSVHLLPGAPQPIALSPPRNTVTVPDAEAWAAGRGRRSVPELQGSVE